MYHKDPKYLDRPVCANNVDPDQTAPEGVLIKVYTVFILSASFGPIAGG